MKDAQGHGSNERGGVAAHQGGVEKVGKPMSAGHFELIARTLAHHGSAVRVDPIAHSALISEFADKLAKTNPRFDRQRFIETAAGKR